MTSSDNGLRAGEFMADDSVLAGVGGCPVELCIVGCAGGCGGACFSSGGVATWFAASWGVVGADYTADIIMTEPVND